MHIDIPRRVHIPYIAMVSIIATAYWAIGKLALLLAIPPGYATAVWPPAGIALAAFLVYGTRVWPGVVLGSFLVNVWTAFDPTNVLSILQSLALPTSIGAGAALQAHVGACLVRRVMGCSMTLDRTHNVTRFLVLGGPVSCLVGATWGVTSLLVSGIVPWGNFFFTWWNWWVGDTIGVLVVSPLILMWTAEPRQVWRHRQLSVALPLCLAFGLVIVFFMYARTAEQARITRAFEEQARVMGNNLKESINGYLEVLHAIESYYASTDEISRPKFRTFVQRLFARHPGIQALSWDYLVPDTERAAYEEAVRQEGYPAFEITEQNAQGQLVRATQRPEYVAVTYIEPPEGNESALGYDMMSSADRLEALQRA
jgi:integral membrane sensor domain MASE1